MEIKMKKEKKRRKKVKRKIRRVYISTVAIILATVTVVFCANYFMYKTDIFNIVGFNIEGSKVYSFEYIVDKTGIIIGEKLFSINRKQIEETLEKEVYIEDCKVSYYIPNKVSIKITERKEKYLIYYNDDTIITDGYGYVLDGNHQNNELFPIESFASVIYNVGEEVKINGLYYFDKINELLKYSDSLSESDKIQKIYIYEDNIICVDTKYGMQIKFELNEEANYSYNFGLTVIKTRLQEGEEIKGCLLDFTKGDSPVFSYGTN